jgi:hypothetical protein
VRYVYRVHATLYQRPSVSRRVVYEKRSANRNCRDVDSRELRLYVCTSAHNIDIAKAREVIRNYARKVRDESGGKYAHYTTSCVAAFPGHNHIASCVVDYTNKADTKAGVYTCREIVEVKLGIHDAGINYTPHGQHASEPCGNEKLYWKVME